MPVFAVNEIIEMAVQIEHNGYAFYHEATKHKGLDPKALKLLTNLRDQELKHEKTFLGLRDNEDIKSLELSQDWELVANYLKTIVDSRIFNTENAAIKLAAKAKNITDILDNAIQFEKDTLLYFHVIKDNIKVKKAQDAVAKIIHEEISHILILTEFKAIMS